MSTYNLLQSSSESITTKCTLWWTNEKLWKIVDFPMKNGWIFHCFLYVHQRVSHPILEICCESFFPLGSDNCCLKGPNLCRTNSSNFMPFLENRLPKPPSRIYMNHPWRMLPRFSMYCMVYLPTCGWFSGQMLVNIPAPWSIWALFIAYDLSCAGRNW